MPADLQKARELFLHAVGKLPPEEWDGYVVEACSEDAELGRQVGRLLQVHREAGSFLDRPAEGLGGTGPFTPASGEEIAAAPAEGPGAVVGPYKLLQQIGEGGMGAVFLAEQTEPVQRKVALKLIKPGMDSRQVVARFEAERQALALMDHPNIARILDGGATESGRPFFVMELVKGVPLTKYCDEHKLTPKQRLELFGPVCQAVQHAHQKGIIHRDLKPSNVLVALYDGKPVPKVIDFGVAKAAGQPLTDKTLFTTFGSVVGTLEYMSPEQAQLNQLDIDTRSDVYSLGVLLYELLTGTTPLERKRLKETGLLEALRIIREEEPPKPSARLSTTDELPAVAASRGLEPRKMSGAIRGELDWIVMKALEKDRNRRYETANSFAADVQRYLFDEPVQACPPSAGYRLGKFARRNRRALATAGVIALALVLAVGTLGWAVRDREARQVEAEKDKAARQAEADRDKAARQAEADRDKAAREAETNRKADEALREAAIHRDHGDWPKAKMALQQVEWLLAAGGSDANRERVRVMSADLEMVSRLEEIRLGPENGEFQDQRSDAPYRFYVDNDYPEAFKHYGIDVVALDAPTAAERIRASAIREQLVALDDWMWMKRQMAKDRFYDRLSKLQQHAPPETVTRIEAHIHDSTAAYQHLRAVADLAAPNELSSRVRDPEVQSNRQALAALADRPDAADLPPSTAMFLADLLYEKAEWARGTRVLYAAQQRSPDDFLVNFHLAAVLTQVLDEKEHPAEQAIGFMRVALALRPKSSGLHLSLGYSLQEQNRLDQAIAEFRKARDLQPDPPDYLRPLVDALEKQGRCDEAIAAFAQPIALDRAHMANRDLTIITRARARAPAGDFTTVAALDAGVVGSLGSPIGPGPFLALAASRLIPYQIEDNAYDLAAHLWFLGTVYRRAGQWDKAVAAFQEASSLMPNDGTFHRDLAWLLATRPDPKLRDPAEAVQQATRAVELQPKINNPNAWIPLGVARYRAGDFDGAIAALKQLDQPNLHRPDKAAGEFFLAMAYWKLGQVEPARRWYGLALETMPRREGPSARPLDTEWRAEAERFRAEAAQLLGVGFDAEQALLRQEDQARRVGVPVETTNSVGMKLRLIPPGGFFMTPQRLVRISKPFFIGEYETTVAQFRAFVQETGYKTDAEASGKGGLVIERDGKVVQKPEYTWRHPDVARGDDYPVGQVSWHDAVAFCEWLSCKEGRTYRLPTEAEWEYACRAGSLTLYSFGDDPKQLGDYAWYAENSGWKSHPVGQKKPNAWGLYDMHGNICEHCQDWSAALPAVAATDPQGPAKGDLRVIRSYGFRDAAAALGSDDRGSYGPMGSMFHFGFRVLCEVPE